MKESLPEKPTNAVQTATASGTDRISSSLLFRCGERLIIEHHGEDYTLQVTRNGKLILTK